MNRALGELARVEAEARLDGGPWYPRVREISKTVARRFGLGWEEFLSRSKVPPRPQARQAAWRLVREIVKLPYMEIAGQFGLDHQTVMWGIARTRQWPEGSPWARALEQARLDLSDGPPAVEPGPPAAAAAAGRAA